MKEQIKRDLDKVRKEASIYGWNDSKIREEERLLKEWKNCAHYDSNGKSINAPEL